jgi:thymidylate synthase ThyX
MKATYIPTKTPHNNTATALEPEVLAACLARYSRTNEGINSILEKYSDKSPTAIFKFIDYGHASIGGLTGAIAIAIDDVSMLAALKLFEFSQMADGQESSTRYIELDPLGSGVVSTSEIGIKDPELTESLQTTTRLGFELYKKCLHLLEEKVSLEPFIARIPPNTPEKTAQRMLKNYGLDRCRYFLPIRAKTNLALVMSARSWTQTLRELESLPWNETKQLSKLIREELTKVAPDLIRHSFPDQASTEQCMLKINKSQRITKGNLQNEKNKKDEGSLKNHFSSNAPCTCTTSIHGKSLPPWEQDLDFNEELTNSFKGKENRYSSVGDTVKRISINCAWAAMALAEIRDLNRHRTGYRSYHSIPVGFYIPEEINKLAETNKDVKMMLEKFLQSYEEMIEKVINSSEDTNIKDYFYFLGTQVPFEHCQQLDKFIYETELRTGLGAHFRYAEHLNSAASSLILQFPEIKNFIKIGTAEPE